jgi:hypothetical protein
MASSLPATGGAVYEQQAGETTKAYDAFCVYRDMGCDRSFAKASKKIGKVASLLARWSVKYHWTERCAAYDTYMELQNRKLLEKARLDMTDRHIKLGTALQTIGVAKLTEWQRQISAWQANPSLPLPDISPGDIAKLLDMGVKIERLSRGEPTEQVDVRSVQYVFLPPKTKTVDVEAIDDP